MSNGKNWNLDLKFEGVTYVELPTSLKGIHIFNGENEDKAYIGTRYEGEDYGNSPNKYMQLYVIVSPGKRFYVMANCVSIETNDLPNDVSSIIKPFARPSL